MAVSLATELSLFIDRDRRGPALRVDGAALPPAALERAARIALMPIRSGEVDGTPVAARAPLVWQWR